MLKELCKLMAIITFIWLDLILIWSVVYDTQQLLTNELIIIGVLSILVHINYWGMELKDKIKENE